MLYLWGQLQISHSCKFCKQVKHLLVNEKATKFDEISIFVWQYLVSNIKTMMEILPNFVAFSEYLNLCPAPICILLQSIIYSFQACQIIIFRCYRMHWNKFWRCILIFTHLYFHEFFNEYSTNTLNILFMTTIHQYIFINPRMFFYKILMMYILMPPQDFNPRK